MRSLSTSALGQPRLTSPTRGAGLESIKDHPKKDAAPRAARPAPIAWNGTRSQNRRRGLTATKKGPPKRALFVKAPDQVQRDLGATAPNQVQRAQWRQPVD